MKQVTLYWDIDRRAVWYKNSLGIWRIGNKISWSDSLEQNWKPEQFQKSLTVNNFKEK
ncbi:hypothetical protein [Proteus phage vB_PmiP_RS10pmA]|nr:hypothetical protein [Proteus phage vB_PmiP_RS10pmA]